jgi:predicted nucleic acid-binding protein
VILVDTSVLSLAYRRRRRDEPEPRPVTVLRQLIIDDVPLAIPGIVLQEILSGIRAQAQFDKLQRTLESFPVVIATEIHHIVAARIANACRRKGIAASAVDCLISALATSNRDILFTLDEDFVKMARVCDLRLLSLEQV